MSRGHRRDRARDRARERQAKGDPRPYMMILHEENVIENSRKISLRGRPTIKLQLPDEITFPDE